MLAPFFSPGAALQCGGKRHVNNEFSNCYPFQELTVFSSKSLLGLKWIDGIHLFSHTQWEATRKMVQKNVLNDARYSSAKNSGKMMDGKEQFNR